MEDERTESGEKQGRGNGESGDHRHEDGRPEHREEMLESENGHLARTEGAGIVDCLVFLYFSHNI